MISEDQYRIPISQGKGLFKDRGSKFLGQVDYVESEDEIKDIIKGLRKEHHTARHVCSAFILGEEGKHYRASDDGEPNNAAGAPILGQLRSFELTFTLVTVVRYFGGTKLGVPGMINAYREGAKVALENTVIENRFVEGKHRILFQYNNMSKVLYLIEQSGARVINRNFTESCEMDFGIRLSKEQELLDKLRKLDNLHFIKSKT